MTIAEQFKIEGFKKGIEAGIEKGIVKGIEKGREQGREQGREEGIVKGLKKGIEKGEMSAKKIIAKNLLQAGMSCEAVSRFTGLSLQDLQHLGVGKNH